MIKIQFKVYDETGRRQHVQEVLLDMSAEEAVDHVKNECMNLRKKSGALGRQLASQGRRRDDKEALV